MLRQWCCIRFPNASGKQRMVPKPKWQYVGLRSKGEIYIYRVGGSILGPFYMNLFLGKLWYGLKQNLGDPSWYDWPLRFWLFWNVFPEYSFVKLRISLDPNIGWIEAHGCMLIWCCAVIFHVKRLVCRVGVGFQIRLLHHFCCDRFFCCE